MIKLIAVQGALAGKSVELPDEATIGRSVDSTLRLDDLHASRKHATIRRTPEGVVIEDQNSSMGTLVNGQRISAPALLSDQDTVQIGKQAFRLVTGEQAAAGAGAQAVPPPSPEAPDIKIEEADAKDHSAIEGTLDVRATMIGGVYAPPKGEDQAKANERLHTIVRISNAMQTELDLNALLSLILDNLFEVFVQADRGFLMLYDDQGDLKPAAARNRQGQTEEITISRKIVSAVTDKRLALLSRDAMADSRFGASMSIANYKIRSMMCAPLIAKDDLLGIIHVDTVRQGQTFTQDDLQLLTGVAAQTALAIASAKMHEKLLLRDRMERDLKIATQVQTSFLPKKPPEVEGMEFATYYQAALDIGGDLYDFVQRPDDNMAVVVGDVSGKGIPAALMMARMSSDVKFYAIQEREPKDVLPHLDQGQADTGMDDVFVTMAYLTVNLKTHEVLIGSAAHCKPLIRRAAEGDVIEGGPEPGFPLGMMPGEEFEQATYNLQPGDVICLVTDGVTEAMDADHNEYGEERLVKAVAAAPPSPEGVRDAVLADIQKHVGDTKQSDDLTMVCFGVKAEHEEELALATEA